MASNFYCDDNCVVDWIGIDEWIDELHVV